MLLLEQRVSTRPWEISTARPSTRGNILTAPSWRPQGKTREELLGFLLYDLVCKTFRLRLVYSFNKYLPEAAACMTGLEDSKGSSVIRARAEAKSERTCQGAETCPKRHGEDLGNRSKHAEKPVEDSEHLP